ncbi:MAG: U32 family peptidase [Clostridia bacterium]|nr:U32 family peptidase [Clostridia bacterium]
MKKVELLSPAGDLEKLKTAFMYGADAVYVGTKMFSLRSGAGNFDENDLIEGVSYAHEANKKVYVALNILPRNLDLKMMGQTINMIMRSKADAVILSDPGLLSFIRKYSDIDIHISTQANITNIETAKMFAKMGAKRLILARELSLIEIKEIISELPSDVEVETFVHGAMCMAYSGRCLLSNFMAGRESNRGDCAQPCRWNYHLVEEKRPGEYIPVYEDERGTYIFNSKDLCLIEHIDELIEAGISSLKIEGRMKSVFYNACTTRGYRFAIDAYYNDKENYQFDERWLDEVKAASHRQFTTGFYFDDDPKAQIYTTSSYERDKIYVANVLEYDKKTKMAKLTQRNKISKGDVIEFMSPDGLDFTVIADEILDKNLEPIDSTPHAEMIYYLKVDADVVSGSLVRKSKENK